MSNLYKTLFKSILIFMVCTFLVTLAYIAAFWTSVPEITLKAIGTILYRYGTILSTPPTVSFFLIDILRKKIKTQWILGLSIATIVCLCMFLMPYVFLWVAINSLLYTPFK